MLTICVCLRGLPHSVLRPVLWQRAVGGGVAGVVELVGGRYSVCLLFLAFLFFSFQFTFHCRRPQRLPVPTLGFLDP